MLAPTREPTFVPTREPTIRPTSRPTREPTPQPTREPTAVPPATYDCGLNGALSLTPTVGSYKVYNATGPGAVVRLTANYTARGFALQYLSGGGIKCYTEAFTPASYFGCYAKSGSQNPKGFAEMIVVGEDRTGQILVPDITNVNFIQQTFIPDTHPGPSLYSGPPRVHLYLLNNCPALTNLGPNTVRWMLNTPVQLLAGSSISIWHSEAFYDYTATENTGYSNVNVYVIQ